MVFWRQMYRSAADETDPAQLEWKLREAEAAIAPRQNNSKLMGMSADNWKGRLPHCSF